MAVRREEGDFHLTIVSRRADQPTGLNVSRGGREMAEVIAIRRRGYDGTDLYHRRESAGWARMSRDVDWPQ